MYGKIKMRSKIKTNLICERKYFITIIFDMTCVWCFKRYKEESTKTIAFRTPTNFKWNKRRRKLMNQR